jgi:ADP-heptose:LPS heptosyltransferase
LFEDPRVVNMTGQLNLEEMISFVGHADGLLACSTGVLHLAAALGKYALGIYAPIKPIHPGRWKPIGPFATYLVRNKDCRKCGKDPYCECIRSITVDQVKNKLIEFRSESLLQRKLVEY